MGQAVVVELRDPQDRPGQAGGGHRLLGLELRLRVSQEAIWSTPTIDTYTRWADPALINGAAGVITAAHGRPVTLVAFTITGAKIVAIDLTDDPHRIAEADLAILDR
jgi:hypothetical protein